MPKATSVTTSRLLSLDYLRGYFVLVIIIDHLSRFPSMWAVITGEGRLWVTAAEGFVMISGLLIGYVRGRRGLKHPMSDIAKKLLLRAATLYIWTIIMTVIYAAITWYATFISPLPWFNSPEKDWWYMLQHLWTLEMPHPWIHFLALYTIFLTLSVGAVILMRRRLTWLLVVLSLITYGVGIQLGSEWMQWQVLFFLPAAVGFYLDTIRNWWTQLQTHTRHTIELSTLTIGAVLLAISVLYIFYPSLVPNPSEINAVFSSKPFMPARLILSGIWFTALIILFNYITPYLHRYTFGVVGYIGTHSLTAYIVHGLVLCIMTIIFPVTTDMALNTIYGLIAIISVYGVLQIPLVKRYIPR